MPDLSESPTPHRVRLRAVLTGTVLVALVVASAVAGGLGDPSSVAGALGSSTTAAAVPTAVSVPPVATSASGRVAYVTPNRELFVAATSDDASPRRIGDDVATTNDGLAPLAWSSVGDRVAYIKRDRSLVLASPDGSEPDEVIARDAVVPGDGSATVLSLDSTSTFAAYLTEDENGRHILRAVAYAGEASGKTYDLTDPSSIEPTSLAFSPLDPYILFQAKDAETGDRLPMQITSVGAEKPTATPLALGDISFAPDSAYIYGVITGTQSQLVRVSTTALKVEALQTRDRICAPQASSDGTQIVFGSGTNCEEVWAVNSDGSRPRRITTIPRTAFGIGGFSWSLDDLTVSHPNCRIDGSPRCGDGFIDIDVKSGKVTRRAVATSVLREVRPLVKSGKVRVHVEGALTYDGGMVIPSDVGTDDSANALLQLKNRTLVDIAPADEADASRVYRVKLLAGNGTSYVVGSIHLTDPTAKFDHEFMVFGQFVVLSSRYAQFRGIWLTTSQVPFKSGSIDVTIYR